MTFHQILFLAGIGQLILIVGSLAIPKLLNWKQELAPMKLFYRQMFWTYSGYIYFTNLSFGLVSTFATESLLEGSQLAFAVNMFIAIYWGARVFIQFFYFDKSEVPKGWIYQWGEIALVGLFVFLTGVYGYAAWLNYIKL